MDSENSMLKGVQSLYDAIFSDLVRLHPSISTDLQRDHTRLRKAAVSCGLPFYTIALPSAGKWFDKSLSAGRLVDPRPPHFGVKGKVDKRPSILFGLFSAIFQPDGTLQSIPEVSVVSSIRQILLAAKKLRMDCDETYTDKAVNEFLEIERSLPQRWKYDPHEVHRAGRRRDLGGHPIWGDCLEHDRQASLFDAPDAMLQLDFDPDWDGLRRFSARVLSQFGPFDPFAIRPKHGPGAVSDRVGGHIKYDHLHWPDKLECVFPYDWHASGTFTVPEYVSSREFPSVMHAVPKTQSGPRLIAAEPIAHQWIQQGIWRWLSDAIKCSLLATCLDFSSQEASKAMALRASKDGSSATVDLSSASDRLTCRLVDYVFQSRPDLLEAFYASRTRAIVALTGELVELRKFSTQGSALTFPVQSIVFCILALWSVCLARGWKEWEDIKLNAHLVRVFGDDIIVPTDAYPVLTGLLTSCLLKVNESKSHATGFFRESCGMDAFRGDDVTPAYFREPYSGTPESLVSVIEVSNNFFKKGFWLTADHLSKTVPVPELKLVPVGAGFGSVGLFSFCGESVLHLKSRWNDALHREEYRIIDISSKTKVDKSTREGGLRQFFFEEPDPTLPYESGEPARPRLRKRSRWVSR